MGDHRTSSQDQGRGFCEAARDSGCELGPPPAEVINPDTGEVVKNEAAAPPASKFDPMNPDDIPF